VKELRVQFRRQIGDIEAKVAYLFALVAEGLTAATHALLGGESDFMNVLAERERAIDALYRDIEELVNQQMALQAPVANDLRFFLSVPELERSHDLVLHIAHHATYPLSQELTPRMRGLIAKMGAIGADMWRQAANSWYQRDGTAAELLDERDDEIDTLHEALTLELAKRALPTQALMDMTLVACFYERLCDHAVNVARRVVYLAGTSSLSLSDTRPVEPETG
jgi:phosphate transport system protein